MITHVHLDLNPPLKAAKKVKLIQRKFLRRYRFFSSSFFSPDYIASTEGEVMPNTAMFSGIKTLHQEKTHSISYASMCEQAAVLYTPGTGSHPEAYLYCKQEQVASLHNLRFQIACYLQGSFRF